MIPKEQAETLHQLSDDSAQALGRVLPRIIRAVLMATGAQDYNILQNNGVNAHQVVKHVHIHIIPKYDDGSGLGISWPAKKLESDEDAAALAQLIRGAAVPTGVHEAVGK